MFVHKSQYSEIRILILFLFDRILVEPIYVDIPTMHLLTYYPNLDVNPGKNSGFLLPQLTTTATNHVSIPLYATTISQKPTITPVKQAYQIQYAPKYNAVPGASSTKVNI